MADKMFEFLCEARGTYTGSCKRDICCYVKECDEQVARFKSLLHRKMNKVLVKYVNIDAVEKSVHRVIEEEI